MPIEIDITKIPMYKEAYSEGEAKGEKTGEAKKQAEIILNLFKNKNLSVDVIADLLNLKSEDVEVILKRN